MLFSQRGGWGFRLRVLLVRICLKLTDLSKRKYLRKLPRSRSHVETLMLNPKPDLESRFRLSTWEFPKIGDRNIVP